MNGLDPNGVTKVVSISICNSSITGGGMVKDASGRYTDVVAVGTDMSGVKALSRALPSSEISELVLSNCGIGPEAMAILSAVLQSLTTQIEVLDISNNLIGDDGKRALAAAVLPWVPDCARRKCFATLQKYSSNGVLKG